MQNLHINTQTCPTDIKWILSSNEHGIKAELHSIALNVCLSFSEYLISVILVWMIWIENTLASLTVFMLALGNLQVIFFKASVALLTFLMESSSKWFISVVTFNLCKGD